MSASAASRIVVIGASTGGNSALPVLLGSLPRDFPAAVFVVLHLAIQADDLLPKNLRRKIELSVESAKDRSSIEPGHVYVAPPDFHLTLEKTIMRVIRGPRENRSRPAIDPLFRSAALAFGPRATGVLLTGKLDDGAIGLNMIKTHGGTTIVQDPAEAAAPDMIQHALRNVQVDEILPLSQIAARLVELVAASPTNARRTPPDDAPPAGVEEMETQLGAPIPFVCPECHGPLWQRKVGAVTEFRCHVGHAYAAEALLIDQDLDLEKALWSAVRMFDEQAALLRRIGNKHINPPLVGKWENRARQNEQNAKAVRRLLQARRPV